MAEKPTAVAFVPGAPIAAFDFMLKTMSTNNGPVLYMDCTSAKMDGPFLRLEPKKSDMVLTPMAVFVHPHHVAWVIEAADSKQMGFLSGGTVVGNG